MTSVKSEVVSVRVEPRIKAALQTAADCELRSLANMVEVMVISYCRTNNIAIEGLSPAALPDPKVSK